MLIRTLTPEDVDGYVALRREMLADAPWAFSASVEDDVGLDAAHMRARLIEAGNAIVGAFDDQRELVGAAGIMVKRQRKMSHRAHIWGVYVTPSARRAGLARTIMLHTIQLAHSWPGISSVSLSASVNSVGAVAMYQGLGFVVWGREPGCIKLPDGRCFDELHMVLDLAGTVAGR